MISSVRRFVVVSLIVSLWVIAGETFRYFVVVMPGLRSHLSMVPNVAPMDTKVFCVWSAWMMTLTFCLVFMTWIVAQRFGNSTQMAVIAGTISWCFFFVLFWVGMVNMNLAPVGLALVALPLAWIELVVASLISSRLFARNKE